MNDKSKIARGVIMIILLLMVYYNQKVSFHQKDAALDKMKLKVESSLLSQFSYRLIWFEMAHRTIRLHCNSLLETKEIELYAITPEEKVMAFEPGAATHKLSKKAHSGTFAAVLPVFQKDLNRDGVVEKVQVVAKVDTLFAQVGTIFRDRRIPLEIVKGKNGITVLFQQAPLANQSLRLISSRRMNKVVKTDARGMIKVPDIRDLRKGISIIYLSKNHTCYIASYLLEAYSIFSPRHVITLRPLVKVVVLATGLVALFILIRELLRIYSQKKLGKIYLVK
jgi:hypothetical protein